MKLYKILKTDPYLKDFERDIELRMQNYKKKKKELLGKNSSLVDFANGYNYFGFHRTENGWVYREWAPGADEMYLTGDFNGWETCACPMKKLENGIFEVEIEGRDTLMPGQNVQAIIIHEGKELRRIPLYATRVVQDSENYLWCAEIEDTFASFPWTDEAFKMPKTPFIYECHIGMAQDKYGVGTYAEFRENILPELAKPLGKAVYANVLCSPEFTGGRGNVTHF